MALHNDGQPAASRELISYVETEVNRNGICPIIPTIKVASI